MATIPGLMTIEEVAKLLRVSPGRVSQFKRDNRLKPAKFLGRMPLFPVEQVVEFASQDRPEGRPKKNRK